jgi:RNA polymerase sigma-70 factor, ECF subfamily
MYPSAVPAELTIRTYAGESVVRSQALPMVERSDKALPHSARSASTGVAGDRASGNPSVLDEAMDRYARGEDAAFDLVYRQAAPRLRGFLLRMCSDPMLADDLTQEAFVRLHLSRGSFAVGAAALPWMLAIARNAFLDHTRRHQVRRLARERVFRDPSARPSEASAETRGDEVVAARETLEIVRVTLDRMSLASREAFVLLRFEGLSVRDAAQVLGVTEAAVKVRAFRAYEMLRTALDRESGGSMRRP